MDRKNRRGVTLIELLVAMSVSGLVLIGVLGIFGFSTRQLGTQTGRAQTQVLGNQAMNAICKEIGQAISVGNDPSGNPTEFIMPSVNPGTGGLLGALVGGVLNYTPGSQTRFYLSDTSGSVQGGTCLWRSTATNVAGNSLGLFTPDSVWSLLPGGSPALPKFPNVTALTFSTTGMPSNTVKVTLTMADKEGSQTSSYTVSRIVYLSNHN
jgi:prepilin-type N-terminal cleavage/methylation domain-containing protein